MSINRRHVLGGSAALAAAGILGRGSPALAQTQGLTPGLSPGLSPGLTPGKPYAGQEISVLHVRSSQYAAQAKRAPQFTEATGIKVNFVDVPFSAMRERLTAEMVAQSTDFDLATIIDVWIPPMVQPYLMPLNAHLQKSGIDTARYPGAFLHAGVFDGEAYGLPTRCHIQLLFYRKDIFDELGLQPPATWDELVSVGKTIQEKKGNIAGVAIPYGRSNGQNLMVWYNFLWGAGGDLFDADMKPAFNSPEGLRATQDYVDLMLKHKITPTGATSFVEQDATGSFVQGKSAMIPVWWHVYNRIAGADSAIKPAQVGFVRLPTYPGAEHTTYVNDWIYGVNKNSRSPEAALEFLTWATQPELERSILLDPSENDVVAVHWSNLRDPEVNKRFNGMHAIAAQALEKTRTIPNIPEFLPVVDVLEVAMSNIATGQQSVADAMNGAASQVSRIMRRAR